MNAKRLLTVWGTIFNEYAYRMWQGLVGNYYYSRWEKWISAQRTILNSNHSGNVHFDPKEFMKRMKAWEKKWVEEPAEIGSSTYLVEPNHEIDVVAFSQYLYKRYIGKP
jgi:hypothetical protein